MSRYSHQISVQKELVLTAKETETHVSIVNIQIDQDDTNHLDVVEMAEMQDKISISSKKSSSDQSLSGTSFSSSLGKEDSSEGDFGPSLLGSQTCFRPTQRLQSTKRLQKVLYPLKPPD